MGGLCQGRGCCECVCYPQSWVSVTVVPSSCSAFKPALTCCKVTSLHYTVCTLMCVGVYVCARLCVRVHVREWLLGYAWKTPGMCWCLHFSPLNGSICCSTIDTVLACFSVKDPGGFLHIWQCLVPLPGESRPLRQWLCYSPQPSLPGHLEASWFVSLAHLSPHAFPISICTSTTSSH